MNLTDPILWTAAGIALVHTVLGPDHYLPFVALGKSRQWSLRRTLWTTVVCGIGHVGTSLAIALGIAAGGWTLAAATDWQGLRGDTAAWLLLGFGVAYALWGIKQLARRAPRPHSHAHAHADGTVHDHGHDHRTQHLHPHDERRSRRSLFAWSLFVVFVLGPCEPLVPLMLVPASQRDSGTTLAVAIVFVFVTIVTMTTIVTVMLQGVRRVARFVPPRLDRYGHVAAGSTIACCGVLMLLGL